ncbi:thiamine pyrophosphate-binding protein [Streptomyces sp. NPDC088252]|uniref:thiamine pyrophosphate-binding protein n=1 Tax=Streptomyces sp. NPDC088252 TaxID=3365845 RepID=UPI0038215A83
MSISITIRELVVSVAPQSTVHSVTYDLLRSLELTTVFGNPGSTEQPFLQDFPDDFTYVLALQEASVVAMADAFAQVTRRPALVNVHSSAGLGNSLGNLVTAYHGSTPLIVTSGQQHARWSSAIRTWATGKRPPCPSRG